MRTFVTALTLSIVFPSLAAAHVGVRPRESKPGAEERYTVRVPTEGAVATTSVRLEIPDDVTVLDVEATPGATFTTEKRGDRVIAIEWTKGIPPKEMAEFVFRAKNPVSGDEIAWKAHQHFSDKTVADWVGPTGDKRPAPQDCAFREPAVDTNPD